MKNKLSIEEVRKIAKLSALDLTEYELKNFVNQFSVILDYFELLKRAEIDDFEIDISERNIHNGREDKVFKSPVSPENFSPYLEGQFFKIPRVIDQDK